MANSNYTVGVLALQGDFREHQEMLASIGVDAVPVRMPAHLADLDGLIMPGGESTAMARLARANDLMEPLRKFAANTPTWGTCAGAILLANRIEGESPHLGLMDIQIERNAFGAQLDSFVADLHVKGLVGEPLRAVFIRAPIIRQAGPRVDVLSCLPDGRIVAVRQGHLLATAFHPELTPDQRMHRFFVEMIRTSKRVV